MSEFNNLQQLILFQLLTVSLLVFSSCDTQVIYQVVAHQLWHTHLLHSVL